MSNPLLDNDFLNRLNEFHEKEIWAKIIALDINENPTEEITGRITQGGSINVDGASAVRRSCSLSMVAKEVNINDFYWGLHSKFKLEMGLTNKIDSRYPDIIWFPQGIFLITSFSTSQSVNNYTISIQGKDKMALLNGEIGGTLTAPIDFGKIEERDEKGNLTISDIPIKEIIMEGVHEYAKEPWHNIVINDLDDYGIELLDYKGSKPLYMLVNEATGEVQNMTMNAAMPCTVVNGEVNATNIGSLGEYYNKLNEFYPGMTLGYATVKLNNDETIYSVAKIEYGQTAGYRLTDITYAGDLIANQGDALTSILDKIVSMLGDFEYFYDLDGRFIFQRKKTYIQQTWNNIIATEGEIYNDPNATPFGYEFKNNNLITSFSNNPNLTSLKNDFSIWGVRKSATGSEIPVHLRYAIDHKPFYYKTFDGQIYCTDPSKKFPSSEGLGDDWREIIYQMAKDYRKHNHDDDFLVRVRDNNFVNGEYLYPNGYTGYEQYYIDMEGFWRQLYNPDYRTDDPALGGDGAIETEAEVNAAGLFSGVNIEDIYIYPITKISDKQKYTAENSLVVSKVSNEQKYNINPFINNEICYPQDNFTFYKYYNIASNENNEPTEITIELARASALSSLYIKNPNNSKEYIKWVDYLFNITPLVIKENETYLCAKSEEKIKLINITDNFIKGIYSYQDGDEVRYWPYYFTKVNESDTSYYWKYNKIKYYHDTYNYYGEGDPHPYWHKNVWNAPELLNFWFDFMDSDGEMNKYSVSVIGNRPKVVNDSNIKAIYFRETPTVIFINKNNEDKWKYTERKSGYTYIQIPESMLSLFNISSQGKSAQNMLEECMYNDTYCIETVSMNIIPIYYLQPNTRIYIRDDNSKIDGEYIVSRFTIPLTYNGTMSISATKIADRIY